MSGPQTVRESMDALLLFMFQMILSLSLFSAFSSLSLLFLRVFACFCNIRHKRGIVLHTCINTKSGLAEASSTSTSKGQPVDILCISHGHSHCASLGSLPLILRLIFVLQASLSTALCKSGFAN